jgi:hypothetical protein
MAYTAQVILPLLYLVQTAPPAPPVEEIVAKAVDAMERHPEHMVCRVSSERQILDGDGNVDEDERAEIEETRTRDEVEWKTIRKWKNGKEITADVRKEEERKRQEAAKNPKPKKKDDDLMEPFSKKWSSHYTFQYVRSDTLWGHPAYVLRVTSHDHKEKAGNGLVWIDANDFIQLKGEFVPAKLPDNADWARFQVQYTMHPSGVPVPSLLKFEGAGHKWVFKKGFRQVIRWQGCR